MIAEGGGGIDRVAAGVAVGGEGGCRTWVDWSAKDLAGDVHGLHGVVLADASGHEEALDKAEERGDSCPEKDEIQNAESIAAKVEVMDSEGSEEQSE